MKNNEIVKALREHAEWAQANEWEAPITLSDDLAEAAALIEKLTDRCARYAEEIAVAQEQTRRIPVTERLPEYTVCVLVAYSNGAVEVDAWGHDGWMDEDLSNGAITHWMPLPAGLEEE